MITQTENGIVLDSMQKGAVLQLKLQRERPFGEIERHDITIEKEVNLGGSSMVEKRDIEVYTELDVIRGDSLRRDSLHFRVVQTLWTQFSPGAKGYRLMSMTPRAVADWLCGKGYTRRQRQLILKELRQAIEAKINLPRA